MNDRARIPGGLDNDEEGVQRKRDALGPKAVDDLEDGAAECRQDDDGSGSSTWRKWNDAAGSTFAEVFQAELDARDGKQEALRGRVRPARLQEVNSRARAAGLTGLALSGGGIRSATFNLGVLQGLAQRRLLREFDYLSTVSGGGFIGGWLTKLIAAHGGRVEEVEEALTTGAKDSGKVEHDAVQFLRQYSNYMAPKLGFLSADTWTLLITYLRNTMLNMAMVTAWLACLLLLPRVLAWSAGVALLAWPVLVASVSIGCFLAAVLFIAYSISRKGRAITMAHSEQSQEAILLSIGLPLTMAALAGSLAVWKYQVPLTRFWQEVPASFLTTPTLWLLAPGFAYFLFWCTGWLAAQVENARDRRHASDSPVPERLHRWPALGREFCGHFLCAAGALAVGTALLLQVLVWLKVTNTIPQHANIVTIVTFGMPALQCLFALTLTLMIGLLGRLYSDQSREWWARLGAWVGIIAFSWTALFCATFYLPPLLHWAYNHYPNTTGIGGAITSLLALAGLRAGSSAKTGPPQTKSRYDPLIRLAPLAFVILVLAAVSIMLQQFLTGIPAPAKDASLVAHVDAYLGSTARSASLRDVLELLAGFGLAALILGSRLDVNKFSLYMMYRMRLVRAYFGASTVPRKPHPFTGFDPEDDPDLASFSSTTPDPVSGVRSQQRPYHIINAALNLVGGKDLAWQTRKATNFTFTPLFCGFEAPSLARGQRYEDSWRGAFRPTSEYACQSSSHEECERIKLGAAVAMSGAAASPNMGYHSSPPLAFLMTLFNLRLGRWCPNPMKIKVWRRATPRVAMLSILAELFGRTDMNADFLYLSDGGHFENLGLYELVRRRCRLIVVVDASADAAGHFDDLGIAIRRCSTDFHIPIELNARAIRSFDSATGQGASSVTGRIRYAQADGRGRDGLLVYIKPTIVGDENADIFNYSKMHPEFPHQSTADQFFDENQFESYRSLGYQTALRATENLDMPARFRDSWRGELRRYRVARLCTLLQLDTLRARKRKTLSERQGRNRRRSSSAKKTSTPLPTQQTASNDRVVPARLVPG